MFAINAVTDKSNGGASVASLTKAKDHWLLDCQIIHSNYPWPFCEVTISFVTNKKQQATPLLDLSSFSRANVYAKYIADKNTSIRFQLRSFNQAYSTMDDPDSWKYNSIEYWPNKNQYPVSIPMSSLQVATWWLNERAIPIENSSPEFKQIALLEIATGVNVQPGRYQLKIERIEFIGKIFSNTQVYTFVIIMWISAALFGLLINNKRAKQKLDKAIKRTKELKQLNRLLNVESEALKQRAVRDPLTGALNREGVESIFSEEIKILSLMFIDIDHFKAINDNYGHAIGDEILVAFAQLISENSRSTDFLVRWGGEEFLLICPNTNLKESSELADSLRQLINNTDWVEDIKLSASFGVAQRSDESSSQLIARADQALYKAKVQGRNKVVVSKPQELDSSVII